MKYSPRADPGRSWTPPGGWWSHAARKLHLTLAIALPGCLLAGWFELTRALNGREIAWVYAGEWPLYGILGIYMWWRLLHAEPSREPSDDGPTPAKSEGSVGTDTPSVDDVVLAVDPELAAWQAYLRNLQKVDPPGAPPPRNRQRPRAAQ